MKSKLLCVVLCASVFFSCEKGDVESEIPEKPSVEKPDEPENPSKIPSTDNIFNFNNEFMIIGTTDWASIAYGNGRYVVVGYGGYVTSSTDGIVWETPKIIPRSDFNWVSVTFGNGKFVAIDSYSTCNVMTSIDGINWMQVGKVINNNNYDIYSVSFCNGLFIVVGEGLIYTSSNGTSWTRRMSDSYVRAPYAVAYGNSKFVAVGYYGFAWAANDGFSWTENKTGIKSDLNDIAFSNEKFVAVGSSGYIITSFDGITWTSPKKVGTHPWLSIAYCNGKFLAVGENGYITTSTDGENWTTPEQIKDESGNIVTAQLNGVCAMP